MTVPPRVLIVDDNPVNLILARTVLEAEPFEVAVANDAAAAMQSVFTFSPSLILLDIQMPGMDGIKLLSILKSTTATAGIIVIAFTSYAMAGDRERLLETGFDGYLSKPINVKTFASQVRQLGEK